MQLWITLWTPWGRGGGGSVAAMRRRAVWVGGAAVAAVVVALAAAGWGEEPGALTNWQALVLGVVQGATELLPISSSGHLILVPWLADWTYLEEHDAFNQTFDVALHLGTLVAVVAYFRREIVDLAGARGSGASARRRVETPLERIGLGRVRGHDPGGARRRARREPHRRPPRGAVADRDQPRALRRPALDRRPDAGAAGDGRTSAPGTALGLGLAQSLALMPGVSRSGITITAGRFLGLDRDSAARLSFLLLVPITVGAVLFKGLTDVVLGDLPPGLGGAVPRRDARRRPQRLPRDRRRCSNYVRRHTYTIFVVYRLFAAAVIVLLIASGARGAGF